MKSRYTLRVDMRGQGVFLTALRFNPDTAETARAYGEKGIRDGWIDWFEVVDKIKLPRPDQ